MTWLTPVPAAVIPSCENRPARPAAAGRTRSALHADFNSAYLTMTPGSLTPAGARNGERAARAGAAKASRRHPAGMRNRSLPACGTGARKRQRRNPPPPAPGAARRADANRSRAPRRPIPRLCPLPRARPFPQPREAAPVVEGRQDRTPAGFKGPACAPGLQVFMSQS